MKRIKTRAKTSKGIARAYIKEYGIPSAHEWSAGGSSPKGDFDVIPAHRLGRGQQGDGCYVLTATSFYNGRPAGVIFGPTFVVG